MDAPPRNPGIPGRGRPIPVVFPSSSTPPVMTRAKSTGSRVPRSRTSRQALLAMALLPFALLVPVFARESSNGLPPIDATTSLLVVSPHPDDEILCCAGVIQRVRAAGGRVSVVWITSGDGSVFSMLIVERTLLPSREQKRELAARR